MSEYILNKILRLQARLLVSCFSKLGLDFPLKPKGKKRVMHNRALHGLDDIIWLRLKTLQECLAHNRHYS